MTTGLERVLATVKGEEPDRVPCCPLICGAARRVYGIDFDEFSADGELAAKAWIEAEKLIGFDAYVLLMDLSVEAADLGQEVEILKWDTARPNYGNPIIQKPEDYLDKVCRIDVTKAKRMQEYVKTVEIIMNERGHETAVVAFVFATLGTLGMMRGAERLFMDCVKHQEQVMKAQEVICEVLEDYIDEIGKRAQPHGMCLDTLYASQGIMSKKLWKKVEAPFAKRLADRVRANNSTVWVHNCGNGVYFDAQIEAMDPIGISYAYVSDDCKDFAEMKEKYGDKVTMMGHVNPAERLFLGSHEELMAECKFEIDTLARGGRYILAPGCEFPPNGNLNRALGMMEAAETYGKYPIQSFGLEGQVK